MEGLIKIREISSKYDISARTLRYYEDMGLISSTVIMPTGSTTDKTLSVWSRF